MQRRFALATALGFTVVVMFAVIAFGRATGLLGGGSSGSSAAQADAPATLPPAGVIPTLAPAAPQVVTEYVYVDAPVERGRPPEAPSAPPAADEEPPTAAPPTAGTAPTQVPPTNSPARAPASAQPSPTQKPPVAPTAAPQQSATPSEIEFVGTVTAIDGNTVTFSYAGTTVDVQVSSIGSLQIGTRVHVHARLRNGVYVADEIEQGD